MSAILERVPTFAAWAASARDWWHARTPRERLWLRILAVLLLVLLLIFAVIRPLQAARAQALADIRTYETYNARLQAAGSLAPVRAARTGTPQSMVSDSAIAQGLSATVEPAGSGVRASVADGSYDSLVTWLADVGATTDLRVTKVAITPGTAPGRVAAQVEFAP